MLEKKSKEYYFFIFVSAAMDGIGLVILSVVLEGLVRFGIYTGFLKSGLEWFSLVSLSVIGLITILFKSVRLWSKIRSARKTQR